MTSGLRIFLITAELIALVAILAVVPQPGTRVALGLIVGLLLARNALIGGRASGEGPPEGLPDRREDHLYRHWVGVLVKRLREFHTVCQGLRDETVNLTVGRMRLERLETELDELLSQVMELGKPPRVRRKLMRRSQDPRRRSGEETYGQPTGPD